VIWQLMKREPAWRWAPVFALGSAVLCLLWHFIAAKVGLASNLFFLGAFAALPVAAASLVPLQQGDTALQSILPVTVRQVYLARVLSMITLLCLPLAVTAVFALALPDTAAPVLTLLVLVSILSLAIVAIQSAGIFGFAAPRILVTAPVFMWFFGVSLMADRHLTRFRAEKAGFPVSLPVLACWIVSGAIFIRTWHAVPKSFQSAPLKMMAASETRARSFGPWKPAMPWVPVLRSMLPGGGAQLLFLFLFMIWGNLRPYLFLIFSAGAWQAARPRVRWLFALPLPPRVVLAAVFLPLILSIDAGYLISVHVPSFPAPYMRGLSVRSSQIYNGDRIPDCKMPNVLPSWEFWVRPRNGVSPLIHSPWGETFQPPVIREFGFQVYNPYAVGCGSSDRFFDWQFNRATSAVYERPIPPDKDIRMITGYRVVTSLRTQFVNLMAYSVIALLAMIVSIAVDGYRFRRLPRVVRGTLISIAVAAGAVAMMLDAGDKLNLTQWLAWALPQSTALLAAVAIPVLALLYWLLDMLFRQVELVDKRDARAA
jgi:hypothetical protein